MLINLRRKLADPAGRTALLKRAVEYAARKFGMSHSKAKKLSFKLFNQRGNSHDK